MVRRERPIGFVDSGVGGLPYLQWAAGRLPNETFVYVADRANFPYGPKSAAEVFRAVADTVAKLIAEEQPKLIVLACNTASVVALHGMRELYPDIPFVGVVPAVKPAGERSKKRRVGIFATARTIHDPYTDDLVAKYAGDCRIVRLAGPDIVSFVEKDLWKSTAAQRTAVVKAAAQRFLGEDVDAVVLACTHFLYVKDELRRELGDGILIIDSTEGVGRQIIKLLDHHDLRASGRRPGKLFLTGSAAPEPQYATFAKRFALELAGPLP